MSEQVIFSKPYGRVLVDADVPCVITQWHAFANSADFIDLMETALRYLEAHSTRTHPWGLVGDTRQMSAIPAKAQAWLIAEFNPRATAAGLRQVSVVVAQNVFGQVATQRYAQETEQTHPQHGLRTALFDTLDAAKQGARQANG